MISRLLSSVADTLFPPVCPSCRTHLAQSPASPLCYDCRRRLLAPRRPLCRCCPRQVRRFDQTCRVCRLTKPAFTQARSVFAYTPVMQRLLHHYKYGRRYGLRTFFAESLIGGLQASGWDPAAIDGVTPVPQHWWRTWQRGFDAVSAITELFCRTINLPMVPCLRRVRWTPFQARSRPSQRWTNLRNAFTIKGSKDLIYHGGTWLVIDDVFTTGATAHEAAAALRRAGIRTVYVLTMCAAAGRGPTEQSDQPPQMNNSRFT